MGANFGTWSEKLKIFGLLHGKLRSKVKFPRNLWVENQSSWKSVDADGPGINYVHGILLILKMQIAWSIMDCTGSIRNETKCLENKRGHCIVRHTERLSKEKNVVLILRFTFNTKGVLM